MPTTNPRPLFRSDRLIDLREGWMDEQLAPTLCVTRARRAMYVGRVASGPVCSRRSLSRNTLTPTPRSAFFLAVLVFSLTDR